MFNRRTSLSVCFLVALLAGCGGADFVYFESITSGPNPGSTLIVVWLSDSPADDAEALEVSVSRVELLGTGRSVVLSTEARTFDLLALQNGVRLKLAQKNVDPGAFDFLRLTLVSTGAGAPRVRRAGIWEPLGFVGASAHVIDVPYSVNAAPDTTVEVHVDFNARTSLVDVGGDLQLDPQLDALDPTLAGSIGGEVRGVLGGPVPDAVIVARRAGVEVRSTRTRADGSYTLTPLIPGTYSVEVAGPVSPLAIRTGILLASGESPRVDLVTP